MESWSALRVSTDDSRMGGAGPSVQTRPNISVGSHVTRVLILSQVTVDEHLLVSSRGLLGISTFPGNARKIGRVVSSPKGVGSFRAQG